MRAQLKPNVDQTPKLRYEYQHGRRIDINRDSAPSKLASCLVEPAGLHRHRCSLGAQCQDLYS